MCDELNVVRLTKSDIEWLEEYEIVMEPLAVCLDILQGEKFMYFGYLIPSISQLISQYENMKINKNFKCCRSLVDKTCFNVEKRFETQLTDSFLIIAAISHPFFKTDWIKNDVKREIAINQFKNAVNEFSQSSNVEDDSTPEISSNKNQSDDNVRRVINITLANANCWPQYVKIKHCPQRQVLVAAREPENNNQGPKTGP
ncbi:hypothetical protein AGLY_017453 [Aphis glycines]|uniref:Uncharacterized protein n=1 Tax=Aphis glycines TaxID=307491 RepID=A0A6G0SV06_APHGL|nr:hypothetical protein AGLY_017453 [Aphis glycines]